MQRISFVTWVLAGAVAYLPRTQPFFLQTTTSYSTHGGGGGGGWTRARRSEKRETVAAQRVGEGDTRLKIWGKAQGRRAVIPFGIPQGSLMFEREEVPTHGLPMWVAWCEIDAVNLEHRIDLHDEHILWWVGRQVGER